jgi:UDP-hydrolysing UDP-N-acetyl-D-glucosamine 2-epimerase
MKKICFFTGTRSEYGLLKPYMNEISDCDNYILQLIVSGMHIGDKFGNTYTQIIDDGFNIDKLIDMNLISDDDISLSNSMSIEISILGKTFDELRPDILVVLGDRYETLIAVTCALIFKIPIVHIAGGDITEFAYDDSIRHAITKMSHIHIVTNDKAKLRVLQMGENPDNIYGTCLPSLQEIINFVPINHIKQPKYFLVIFHPETLLSKQNNKKNLTELLEALQHFANEYNMIFIRCNSDSYNDMFEKITLEYCKNNKWTFIKSLERSKYLDLAYHSELVVGNSSSGVYEIPLLRKKSINIGNRQKGRPYGNSVFNTYCEKQQIIKSISQTINTKIKNVTYPYYTHNTFKLSHILNRYPSFSDLTIKRFFTN